MSGWCNGVPGGSGFISSMTAYLDCQAQTLGSGAWAVLATPGSTMAILLTAFLTIFIAIIGYNLLLGRSLTVRDGTLAAVKIGFVFALATSWPAYRTLVYDLVVDGPMQIVSEIGPASGVIGSDGSLLQRLDGVDRAISQLAILGPGNAVLANVEVVPPPFGGFDAFALGGARILYLIIALTALGAVRIIAGLLLALGPFFIAFLLFENTRSLFEGWVRVLGGAALAAIGGAITLGLELALLEPWLSNVLARRTAGEALPTVSVELLVIITLFAIITVAALYACARIARAFRFAPIARLGVAQDTGDPRAMNSSGLGQPRTPRLVESDRGRAAAIGQVVQSSQRREGQYQSDASAVPGRRLGVAGSTGVHDPLRAAPVGRSFRRRTSSRVTSISNRRDSRA